MPLAGHGGGLHEEDVAAGGGPGQAGGHPGHRRAQPHLGGDALRTQYLGHVVLGDDDLLGLALGDLARAPAAERAQLALQVAQARLAGVALDDLADGRVGDGKLPRRQAVLLALAGHQIALGDLELVLGDVAGDLQDLHAVAQRRRDGVQHVGGGDEDHLGEIKGQVQVVVAEGVVLLRVQHLQEGAAGIATEVVAQLVYLVQHEDRVLGARPPERLDDAPGQSAHVGAAVAAYLGLVAHAAQADAHEVAPHGPGDGAAQRGLAHAGRSGEAEDGPLHGRVQLAHGQVFQDAALDLVQVIVVVLQDLAGLGDVDLVGGGLVPGQGQYPVQVGVDDVVLAGGGVHLGQAGELALGLLAGLLGQVLGHELLLQFLDLAAAGLFLALAQLLLDGLELLAQVVVPLGLVHALLDLALYLAAQLQYLDLAVEQLADPAQALLDLQGLHHGLALLGAKVQGGCHHVAERAVVVDGGHQGLQVVGQVGGQFHHAAEQPAQVADQGQGLQVVGGDVGHRTHQGLDIGRGGDQVHDAEAGEPLGDEPHALAGILGHLEDEGGHAYLVQLLGRLHLLALQLALDGHQAQDLVPAHRLVHQSQMAALAHHHGQDHAREHAHVLDRQ